MKDTKHLKIVENLEDGTPSATAFYRSSDYVPIDGYVCVIIGMDREVLELATTVRVVIVIRDEERDYIVADTHPVNCMIQYPDYNSCKIAALQQQITMMKDEFESFIAGYNEMREAHKLY